MAVFPLASASASSMAKRFEFSILLYTTGHPVGGAFPLNLIYISLKFLHTSPRETPIVFHFNTVLWNTHILGWHIYLDYLHLWGTHVCIVGYSPSFYYWHSRLTEQPVSLISSQQSFRLKHSISHQQLPRLHFGSSFGVQHPTYPAATQDCSGAIIWDMR